MSKSTSRLALEIGLHAVVVAVSDGAPLVLTVSEKAQADARVPALPFGPFKPQSHKTLDAGLRNWVEEQTRLRLGYVEQLYTFGDSGRQAEGDVNFVSVGYLALVRMADFESNAQPNTWASCYRFLPWEDWRNGPSAILDNLILPTLREWVDEKPNALSASTGLDRTTRFSLAFGLTGKQSNASDIENWDEERVLERYELMYEARMVQECVNDETVGALRVSHSPGESMLQDHRRILATALARLRGKLKYRPIVFELLPEQFTLTELQTTVEALSGQRLHKQNFRRMVDKAELVEPTGETSAQTGGRPAAYFRFRRAILRERPAPGLRV